ncbi:MAG: ATP-dependent helicase, partial [Methylophilaceae bacterium]
MSGQQDVSAKVMQQWLQKLQKSQQRFLQRQQQLPQPIYPEELPVSARKDEIAQAIRQHQVVIVCGETGSGKTTQLPKICLELGLGVAGMIGHTQPRRIAARSVASRIAQELDSPLGEVVGYKVRFNDKLSEHSYVKLMTDGILLAETQHDRFLNAYDTIIIDE